MLIRLLRSCLVLACLAVAGCYEVDKEIITEDLAEQVPYIGGSAQLTSGGTLQLSKSDFNNDYRFVQIDTDGTRRNGTMRAMRIRDDLYVVQARYDDENQYYLIFERITARDFKPYRASPNSAIEDLAKSYNVTLDDDPSDENSFSLSGNRADILNFLRAHRDLNFVTYATGP
jgi:hypothetical protein